VKSSALFVSTLVSMLAVTASCASDRASSAPAAGEPATTGVAPGPAVPGHEPALRPAPGVDLAGPIAVPAAMDGGAQRAAPARPAQPVELGSDRAFVPVDVPAPPRGGAVPFSFGDGRRGWVAHVPDAQQLPAAAYGDGKVYISGGFGSVTFYALEAETGRFAWARTNLEDNGPTAAVYQDGRVIFNTESCTLFALDAATGKKLWSRWLGDPTLAQTAVSGDLIYAAHPEKLDGTVRLSAFRVHNGARVWSRQISGELLATPVVHGDTVYASSIHGVTYAFERTRGARRWARRLNATTAPWPSGDELHVSRRRQGREEQIVVGAATGEVLRVHHAVPGAHLADVPQNLDDWSKVWAFEGSRPVVVGGVHYAATGSDVVASDPATGAPLWIRRHAEGAGKRSVGTVAVAGPQVVASTRDGRVFGLDVDTGYTLWAYDLDHDIVAQPIVARGWVYVTTRSGHVIGLEVGDATLDGWHMFGGNPEHDGPVRPAPQVAAATPA
jgi:Ca-activated chloride channel family protein